METMKKAAFNVRALVRQTLGHSGETNGCMCTRVANTLIVIMMRRMVVMKTSCIKCTLNILQIGKVGTNSFIYKSSCLCESETDRWSEDTSVWLVTISLHPL